MSLKIIHTKNLTWIDIVSANESDLNYLKENFKFHPLDFEDIITPATRVKIDEYDDYHFITLLIPVFKKSNIEIVPTEIDFFINKNHLITIHSGELKTLTNLVRNAHQYDNVRNEYLSGAPGKLLCMIWEMLFKRNAPIFDHMNHEIALAEKNVFNLESSTLEHLSKIKKNIIVYRRIMKMHRYVLEKISRSKKDYFKFPESQTWFHNLIEYQENIWNMLTADKESLESFEETNQSLAGHRMNDILRILTIFSVIIFILTLLINILLFAESVSRIDTWPYLLPMTLVILCLITIAMLFFFKRKRWL